MVIGHQKGRNTKENIARNFGYPHPEGYRKALRLMRMAEKFNLPIITLVDTPGAYPGVGSEERNVAEAIAVNIREMSTLRVPIVTAIIGEGGSGGALGLAIADKILMMENAYYSVITPEGCAAILWKDRKFAKEATENLRITAQELIKLGIIDEIITEPTGGAHVDSEAAAKTLKTSLEENLATLRKKSMSALLDERYQKYRNIGQVIEG
jgi:acetyl-CoA carboxylase carboxyl transferase subunit alpha